MAPAKRLPDDFKYICFKTEDNDYEKEKLSDCRRALRCHGFKPYGLRRAGSCKGDDSSRNDSGRNDNGGRDDGRGSNGSCV